MLVHDNYAYLRASYSSLVDIFGPPELADDKSTTCWPQVIAPRWPDLQFEIYDSWSGHEHLVESLRPKVRAAPWFDWSVQGRGRRELFQFCTWLSGEVIARQPKGRLLTAASQQAVNAQLAAGATWEQALMFAAWEETASAWFAWPLTETRYPFEVPSD